MFVQLKKANTKSKRIQESKTGEEPAVAKPRSTCLNSRNLLNVKQPSSWGSDASDVPGNPQLDSESVLRCTRNLARNKDQNPATCSQEKNEDNPRQGGWWQQQRGVENQLERTRLDYHMTQISDYRQVERVFENLRQKLRFSSYTLDAKTNVLIWGFFMSTTMKSSVHLGLQYKDNLVACRNTNFEELKTLFDITLRLIVEQSLEILGVSTMIYTFSLWMRSSQCHDQVLKWAQARVHVYSDSVSCLGKMYDHPEANEKWKSQIREFQQSNECAELSGIFGEPTEFEWKIFPGFTSIETLGEIQKDLKARQINPELIWGKNSIHVDVE